MCERKLLDMRKSVVRLVHADIVEPMIIYPDYGTALFFVTEESLDSVVCFEVRDGFPCMVKIRETGIDISRQYPITINYLRIKYDKFIRPMM